GFLDAINYTLKGKSVAVKVSSPLGDKIDCEYIKLANTAYIEVSKCIGLHLVKNHKNPLYTTTYGLGELILHAINNGCNNFVIGIGGSCTNDGGVGLLQALGYGFLDKNNEPISLGAIGLKDLVCISDKNANKKLKECTFNIACDVTNPLVGQNGASFVFAKQKGASDLDIVNMDNWLQNYANLTKKLYPTANENAIMVGASGGLGFAFKEYLGAKLLSGIELVATNINLKEKIKNCDLVIVGEGKLDKQSLMGKAPIGIAKLSKSLGKKVIAFAGVIDLTEQEILCSDIDFAYSIKPSGQPLSVALEKQTAILNLTATVKKAFNNI
ncbi:MAG: glycerate kinase, partial [Clostridia bacterium]|nr:glycerate kinase [Clostridia bacterium]